MIPTFFTLADSSFSAKKNGRTRLGGDRCAQTVGFFSVPRFPVVLHNDPSVAGDRFELCFRRRAPQGPAGGDAYLMRAEVSFWITSWAPPSTMLVAETRVSTAFSCSSGMDRAPQLHMVDFTLLRVMATLSFRVPA